MSKDYKEYDDLGVRFIYPSNWFVQTETWDKGTYGITVDSPEGSFWSLAIYPKEVDLDAAAKQILGTLDAEYDEIDQAEVKRYVADRVLTGYEVNFFYLDLTSTALVLKFEDENRGYVVYWQTCDRLALTGENLSRADVFDAMTHTLVSNLTGQEVEYRGDGDAEFDFGAPVDEKARQIAENREFYRKKYERQRWEEEETRRREALDDEEIRRSLNDENNDEARRRDWVAADEKLEDFLRVDDEETDEAFEEFDEEDLDETFEEFDDKETDEAFEEADDEEEVDVRD